MHPCGRVLIAALVTWPLAAEAAPRLKVLDAAARVVVTPEARADVAVSIQPGRARLKPLKVTLAQGSATIEGDLPSAMGRTLCYERKGVFYVHTTAGMTPVDDLPLVTVRTPLDADVLVSGGVYGEVKPASTLKLYNAGCGDWRAGDVSGALNVSLSGAGAVEAGQAGSTTVASAGVGDVKIGVVRGAVTVKAAGSGNVDVASAGGPLDIRTAGSGDVRVAAGRSSSAQVVSSGSGDVEIEGAVGALAVALSGSGGVSVAHATGPVSRQVTGSGALKVER